MDVGKQKTGMQRADKMVSGLQHMTCEDVLKKLGLVRLAEKKGRSDNNLQLPEVERQRSLS